MSIADRILAQAKDSSDLTARCRAEMAARFIYKVAGIVYVQYLFKDGSLIEKNF